MGNCLKLITRDPQIAFSVGNAVVIEFVHNQSQINTLRPGVIAPGLSEAMRAEVPSQTDLLTNCGNEFPGLPPF